MNISEAIILAVLAAVSAAIAALWARSEKCLTERAAMAKELAALQTRFRVLVARLSSCSIGGCPFKEWSQDEMDDDNLPETRTHSSKPGAGVMIHPMDNQQTA